MLHGSIKPLGTTDGVIKYGQSRDRDNIEHRTMKNPKNRGKETTQQSKKMSNTDHTKKNGSELRCLQRMIQTYILVHFLY